MGDHLTCDEVLQRLEVYLDREVGGEDARGIARHLAECGECFERQSFVAGLREIERRKCAAGEPLPEGLADRIRRATSGGGSDSA